jgi:hypothetical protein
MARQPKAVRMNVKFARNTWGKLPRIAIRALEELTISKSLSVASGDVLYLDGKWYVTHPGLLRVARRSRCVGIRVEPVQEFCDSQAGRWAFKAIVYKSRYCKGFAGFGDADPSNTSPLVRGAEMRVAETRAVNRALRKAYGIGLCSVDELGSHPSSVAPTQEKKAGGPSNGNGSSNGQPRLRDKLCLLIRKYELDPNLVKRYAADFCGTQELRDAGRDLIEAFVSTLSEAAAKDRAALLCKLNSYSQPEEVRS